MSGNYVPTLFAAKMLVKFYAATVFGAIANTDYEGEISEKGDKVEIRTCPDITIRDHVDGQDLTYENPSPGKVTLLIDKGKYYAFAVNSVQLKQADIAYVNKWAMDASERMKIAIDTQILADVYTDVHASNAGTTAGATSGAYNMGATGSPLGITSSTILDKIVEAGAVLSEQDVPPNDRWIVIPEWMAVRIKLSDLKDASLSGDGTSMLRNGRLGQIDNFTIYASNNLTSVTDSGQSCFHCLFGQRSALTFASQMTETEELPHPTQFGRLIRGLQVYGYKTVKPEAMGDLYGYAA